MFARLCSTVAALLLPLVGAIAQTPPPVTPPVQEVVEEPPPPPPPETEAAGAGAREGRRGRRGGQGRTGQGRGGRGQGRPGTSEATPAGGQGPTGQGRTGQGRSGQGRGSRTTDLPEFTPVAAPSLAALDGKQYFWFTMYPNLVVQFDPETDKIVKKVELAGGMFWRSTLSHDRKRLMVVTNQQRSVEVIDLTTGTLIGNHLFQEEGMILRVRSVRECPGGVHWFVQTDRVKKELDRYSFEATEYLLYDSANQKVVRKEKKMPDVMGRSNRLSADGSYWLSTSGGDIKFLDARSGKELGKIDLSTPRFFGAGPIRLGGTDLLDRRDPNRSLQIFTTTDPVEKRRTNWGLIDIDLKNRKVTSVTEWGPSNSSFGMRVAYKKRIAVAMGRGRSAERLMTTYDLNTGKKITEAYHEFRPRRSLVAISPNADKVYVGVAGSDFEIFDGKTLKRLPPVELEGEIVGTIHVVDGE